MEAQKPESFRDSLYTLNNKGKRAWVYAKLPKGKLHKYRFITTIILLAFFFGMPFLKYQGEPFLMINFFEPKFIALYSTFARKY